MPPSLTRPTYDAAGYDAAGYDAAPPSFGEHTPAADGRLSMAAAGAIILGLSVAAWIIVIQGMRMVVTLVA